MKIVDDSLPDDAQERIATLEAKCREMEKQVRTLLADLLDLKSVSMKMTRDAAHYQSRIPAQDGDQLDTVSPAEAEPVPAGTPGNTTVIRPKSASHPEVPVPEPAPAMVRIMQSDGTFKMEVRRGDSTPRDSSGGWKDNQKSTSLKRKNTR